jgi:quercetin dioxygenase-like cupin family protein
MACTTGARSTVRYYSAVILPKFLLVAVVAIIGITMVMAADPDPLQGFCVGDLTSNITLNGLVCKNPAQVTPSDFVYTGLQKPLPFDKFYGNSVNTAFVGKFPGINTQGISMARLDFLPQGLNVPHWHPRASEVLFVVSGPLQVGFVDENNFLWANTLQTGDVTIFPRGLVHFQYNNGTRKALAIAALSSQNPGRVNSGNSVFGSDIPNIILEKTFNLSSEDVVDLKNFFKSQAKGKGINEEATSEDRSKNLNRLVLSLLTEAL